MKDNMSESHTLFSSIDPAAYAEVSVIAQLAGNNLLARLDFVKLQPSTIVDIGCGTGYGATYLKKRYPDATVFALDSAEPMLRYQQQLIRQQPTTKEKQTKRRNQEELICADATRLPFQTYSVDLIFANLVLPWCINSWKPLLTEWQRILRPEGLLVFSCLGPDTLRQLHPLTLHLRDMHDIGDDLVHTQFSDPVMETEHVTLTYRDPEKWLYELQINGIVSSDTAAIHKKTMFEKNQQGILPTAYTYANEKTGEAGIVKFSLKHLRVKQTLI
jgi:malonyl-CoA O-methyltransferase